MKSATKSPARKRARATSKPVTKSKPKNLIFPLRIGYVVRRAQVLIFQDFSRTMAKLRIRPAQCAVLSVIGFNPGVQQNMISDILGIRRANLVAMLDELEDRGLAKRKVVPEDRRARAICLTKKGEELLAKMNELDIEHDKRMAKALGQAGKDNLIAGLTKLIGALTKP